MDFEAYYAAQEVANSAAREAALVERYNRWIAFAKDAIPQIIAQAHVTPPKEYKRLLIDDQPAITWEASREPHGGDWTIYITTEGDVIVYTSRTQSYRMVIIAPITSSAEIDQLLLDEDQLHQFVRDLPRFAYQAGLKLPVNWHRMIDGK